MLLFTRSPGFRLAAVLVAAMAGLPLAVAEDPPGASPAPFSLSSADDVQDVVFFANSRPVFLRLHIQVDGRPFRAIWDDYLRSLFEYLDRDGDGILTKEEGERAPAAQQILDKMRGQGFFDGPDATARFRDLDTDGDGIVTLEELAAYYRRNGVGPIVLASGGGQGYSSAALTEALFLHLDTNRDGKLSRDELLAAPTVLRKLDLDDDEMISARELAVSLNRPIPQTGQGIGGLVESPHLFLASPENTPARLAQLLLARYDKDQDGRLSRAEIGLDQALFRSLDTNHDGQLDAGELARFVEHLPEIELTLRFGEPAHREPVTGRPPAEGPGSPFLSAVRQNGDAALLFMVGDTQADLRCGHQRRDQFREDNLRRFARELFELADKDKRGYLLQSDLKGPDFQVLRSMFPLADRDLDGKLTEKELLAYLAFQGRAATSRLVLTIAERGRGLFEFLDSNRDGRLGIRELRTAWSRLAPWDRNGDGQIDKQEIPLQFQLTLDRVLAPNAGANAEAVISVKGLPLAARVPKGPLWFRKMDRNGDGDVSPREFLGTRADFQRIDTDGDGLIDPQEAERAGEWFRKGR
jgi:Ca2+-binding EF-hand superfamily protein